MLNVDILRNAMAATAPHGRRRYGADKREAVSSTSAA